MHELSIAGAVVDTAVRHAAGRRVTRVDVRLGELRQVVPDSLAFYFQFVARETLCEGAVLEYEVVPAVLHCNGCAQAGCNLSSCHREAASSRPWRWRPLAICGRVPRTGCC